MESGGGSDKEREAAKVPDIRPDIILVNIEYSAE